MKRLVLIPLLALAACRAAPSAEQEARVPGLAALTNMARGTTLVRLDSGRFDAQRQDAVAHVTVGRRYSDGFTVTRPDDANASLTLQPLHADGSLEARADGVARYGLAGAHAEALIATGRDVAEEIVLIEDAAGPKELSYRLSFGSQVHQARLNGSQLEAIDRDGRVLLRSPQPRILDAAGRSVMGQYALAGDLLSVRWPTEGLTYPIAVDPAVTSSTGAVLAFLSGTTSGSAHDFGSIPRNLVGSSASASSAATITIISAGSSALTITGFTNASSSFTITNPTVAGASVTLPQTLQPGSTLSFDAKFVPSSSASGSVSTTVTVNSNDAAAPLLALSGTAVSATATGAFPAKASGEKLHFDQTYVGVPRTLSVDIYPGALTGTFTCSTPSSNNALFTVSAACTGSGISISNGSVHIPVTFTPLAGGAQSGTITITTSSPSSATYTVDVDGTGMVSNVIASSAVAFGNVRQGTSVNASPFFSNSGTGYDWGTVAVTGSFASDFVLVPTASAAVVPPFASGMSGSWTWVVKFTPTIMGLETATLVFTSWSGATKTIALSGTGVFPAIAQPISVSAGTVRKGSTVSMPAISLKNTGTDNLNIGGGSITSTFGNAADFGLPNIAPFTIAPGATVTVTPTFTARGLGQEAAQAVFTAGDFGNITVLLSATSIFPHANVNPSTTDFGNVRVGSNSDVRAITIQNDGTDVLTIDSFAFAPSGSTTAYAMAASTFPATIPVGSSVGYTFTFAPGAAGSIPATAVFTAGDYGPINVPLAGYGIRPLVAVTSTALTFGAQRMGTSVSKSVAISNTGTDNLSVTGFTVTGNNAADFVVSPASSSLTLGVGASAAYLVTFTPTVAGAESATLTFQTEAGSKVVALSGTGNAPTAVYSVSALDFASVRKGTNSNGKTVTLTNNGNDVLNVTGFFVSGGNASDFTASHAAAPFTVAAGGNTSWSVVFSPNKTGAETATFTVLTDLGQKDVALTGTGTFPIVGLSTNSIDFGAQPVGTTSGALTVTIGNTGTDTAQITSKTVGGAHSADFTVSAPASIAVGATATVSVRFTPSLAGVVSAPITIVTDAGTLSLFATGTGTAPSVSVSAASLDFPNQIRGSTSATQTVLISNIGGASLTVSNVLIAGTNAGDFALSPVPSFPITVAPGGTTALAVAFTPSTTSSETASLDLFFGNGISQISVALSGTGIGAAATVFPATLSFGSLRVGTTSGPQGVQLTNGTSEVLKVTGVAVTGASPGVFTVSPPSGTVIQPGSSALWSATFEPAGTGAATAALTFTTDHGGFSATLSGTGIFPTTVVNATVLDLGTTPKGTTSAPQSFTVTNAGTDTLTISGFSISGPDAADFVRTSSSTLTVAAGATSAPVTLQLTPSHTGVENATLSFTTDNGAETVGLTGLGVFANIVASRATMDFGVLQTNDISPVQTVTLANTGSSASTVTMSLTGPQSTQFSVVSGPGSVTLAPGRTASWDVVFGPSVAGSAAATLTFQTGSGPLQVALSGVGGDLFPQAGISATILNFDPLRVGTTEPSKTLTISNTGTADLTVTGYAVTGTGSNAFAVTPGSSAKVIARGTSFDWTVSYVPTAPGPSDALISFTTDDGTLGAELHGTGQFPVTTLSTTALDFGSVHKDTLSGTQSLNVSNSGTAVLRVASLDLSGADKADFIVNATPVPFDIATNAASSVAVQFKPSRVGLEKATLTLVTDNGPQTVTLAGFGIFPAVALSTDALAFGLQRRGASSAPQTITVTNTGTDTLSVSGFAIAGAAATDFTVSPASDAVLIPPGVSANWSVTCHASSLGGLAATLTFTTNAGNQVIDLSATGVAPATSIAPTSLSFSSQARNSLSDPQQVVLTNTGAASLSISGYVLSGSDPGDFVVSPSSQSVVVAPGATTSWNVFFAPTTGVNKAATFTINSEAGPSSVALTGIGIDAPLTISPTTADLGESRVFTVSSPTTLTISNVASQPYTVRSFTFSGANAAEFAVVGGPLLPSTIAPGGFVTVPVVFTPTAVGPRSATLAAGTGSAATTLSVPLTGIGISSVLVVDPMTVDFGPVVVGVNKTQPMHVTNTGSDALLVQSITLGAGSTTFALTDLPPLPVSVPPGFSINFTASYNPTNVSTSTSSFTVVTDSPVGGTAQVPLTGHGIAPTITTTGTSLNFGTVRVGSAAGVRVFTMTNTGSLTAVVQDIKLLGAAASDYAIVSAPARPFSLAAGGGSATVAFGFNPSVHGTRSATASIVTNATSSAIIVSLFGTGLEPGINVSPLNLDFSVQNLGKATSLPVTLSNDGDTVLHLAAAAIDGTGAAAFAVQTPIEAVALDPGQTITLPVTFQPSTGGNFAGTLHLKSADSDGLSADVTLAGVGVVPGLTVPDTVEFGLVSVGEKSATKTVTFTNTNSTDLVITDLRSDSPEYVIASDALPLTIPKQSSISPEVVFSPLTSGVRAAHLQVYVEGRGTPLATVALDGTGQALQTVKTGCASAGAVPGALMLGVFALLAAGRRRRARAVR